MSNTRPNRTPRALRIPALACLSIAAFPLLTTGCVQQDRYDQLLQAHRSLQEQMVQIQDERDAYQSNLSASQRQAQAYNSELGALQGRYGDLENEFGRLADETEASLRRISQLEIGPLPTDLAGALDELAQAYPELLSFDVQTGMIRFASDFTFDLGRTELKDTAESSIRALAGVLNSGVAGGFEAQVVGHTDNVPIRQASTREKHPTNTHLSVHRAISVRDALVNAGVSPNRVQVAGYGEFRPMVPNGPRGAAENRRVEMFLVPMTTTAVYAQPETTYEAPAAQPAPARTEPMK